MSNTPLSNTNALPTSGERSGDSRLDSQEQALQARYNEGVIGVAQLLAAAQAELPNIQVIVHPELAPAPEARLGRFSLYPATVEDQQDVAA